jgi:hypothetical protein
LKAEQEAAVPKAKQAEYDAQSQVQAQAEDEKKRVDADVAAARVVVEFLKAEQEAAVPKAAAKAEPWPIEAVQRNILEARLQNGKEVPAPVKFSSIKKQQLNPSIRTNPASGLALPVEGIHQQFLETRLGMEQNGKEVPAPVEGVFTENPLSEAAEQTRKLVEAYGNENLSFKKKQQFSPSIRTDPAKGLALLPIEGLIQQLLEARLEMERNGTEVPAPEEEEFTAEALSELTEQTRQLVEAYGNENLSLKKKQQLNPSIRTDPAKGLALLPIEGLIQQLLEARLKMERNGTEMPAPVEEESTDKVLSEVTEQARQSMVEAYGNENLSSNKKQQFSPSIRTDPAKGLALLPIEGLIQQLLEARLSMERNVTEMPAPVEEEFTEEALSETAEQTRQLKVDAYLNKNLSSKKKQQPNLPNRNDPAKGFGTDPAKGLGMVPKG